jgi:prepilin-type N-terminal cleavage/methylation domain-containing protein
VSRTLERTRRQDRGFTLIELLVVMIIIGVLASVAIPVFLNQRAKAHDVATKSDLETVGKEVASFYVGVDPTLALTGTISGQSLTLAESTTSYSNAVQLSSGTTYATGASDAVTFQTGTGCTKASGWVVTLNNPDGATKTFYFSAQNGLSGTAVTLSNACG